MQTISDLFQGRTYEVTKSRRTERGDLISEFTARINEDRGKYKPLIITNMVYLLSIYTTEQLYSLMRKCNEAKSFQKTFWWYVKNK
jgi:hypothetical protein